MPVVFQIGDPREAVSRNLNGYCNCPSADDRIRLMIGNEKCSDAVFLIGDRKETAKRVPVLTGFLKMESETFAAMFSENWIEKEILIKDTDESAMYSLLRWIYCAELVFEFGKLGAVLSLAHKYMVNSLIEFLTEHVESVNHMHMWSIASFAHAFDQQGVDLSGLKERCVNRITKYPVKHFGSADFVNASAEILNEILGQKEHNYNKLSLFRQCVKWAEAECLRQGLQPHPSNKRHVMQPFIHLIPFSGMSCTDFAKDPCESGILTQDEQNIIFRIICGNKLEDPLKTRAS